MANNYQERKQARIDRYRELANKNQEVAHARIEKAEKMAECIPFGQPIIVGHHSEKRDRAFRNKIANNFDKGFEALDKAKYYEHKAQAAENNTAISSDDPEAIKLLKEKLEKLVNNQEFMKTVNKIVNSKKKTNEEKIQEIIELGVSEQTAKKALEPDFCGRIGFPAYALQNNNANIKRVKERITELEKKATQTTTEEEINGIKIVDNVEDNRVQIFFPNIPSEETRNTLKHSGFRWSRYNGCWQSYRGDRYLRYAKTIASEAIL